jgi:DNA-binding response OmpR family regulator
VLLDINIPGINGELVLKELRKESNIPVIMVTSRTDVTDEVLSMSYGADDYVTKPYNPTVLLLRISAILKRTEQSSGGYIYRNFTVNPSKGILVRGEESLPLTKNEMIIFQFLLDRRGQIVSRDELITDLWENNEFVNDNALTVNISRLRSKLADFGCKNAIETRKKQGYILL